MAWIQRHPGILVLLAAVVLGQVAASVARPYAEESVPRGQFPAVAVAALSVASVLGAIVIWLRVRLGEQVLAGVRTARLSLPRPESLPARYALSDPPARMVDACLALVDLVLVLLLQNTLRAPVLTIVETYGLTRAQAEALFVAVVLLACLLALLKLFRTGGPVLVLALWWGLDRLVPTAGFLGAHPVVAGPPASQAQLPTVVTPSRTVEPEADATVVSPPAAADATVVSPRVDDEATDVAPSRADADATVVAPHGNDDATVVAP